MGKIIGAFALRGENSLEAYDGALLEHGDAAVVFTPIDTKTYTLDANSGAPEDSHLVIAPSVNPGPKRWIWVTTEDNNTATKEYVNNRVADASNITSGMLPSNVLPPLAITSVYVAASQAAMLALTTQEGDVVVRSDQHKSYVRNSNNYGTMGDFTELQTPTDSVLSVNAKTGAVVLNQDDIGDGATYVRSTVQFNQGLKDLILAVSSNYMRSNASASHTTGTFRLYMADDALISMNGTPVPGAEIYQPTLGKDAFITCHVGGDFAAHLGISGADNDWYVGGYSMGVGTKYKLHHDKNNPVSTSADVNTLVKRNSGGHIYTENVYGRYLYGTHVNISHSAVTRNADTVFYSSTDDFIRKNSKAGFLASLGLDEVGTTTGSNANGFYVKNADGTIFCSGVVNHTTNWTTQYFPIAFTNASSIGVTVTPIGTSSGCMAAKLYAAPTVSSFTYGAITNNDNLIASFTASYNAIGR